MYLDYWGLSLKPFENTPDPRFLFASDQHEEGLSRLLYVIEGEKPAGLLTGVFGYGKTLLAHALLSKLNPNIFQVAFVTANPGMKPVEVLRGIARALGAEGLPEKLSDMSIDHFHEVIGMLFKNNIKDGKRNLVIVDEAHTITDPNVFEELRLLLNYQTTESYLLTLFLMGQPELRERIQKNKQFLQRIPMAFHLEALKPPEVALYIQHRLKVAGLRHADPRSAVGSGEARVASATQAGLRHAEVASATQAGANEPIFTDEAIKSIATNSGGIPRRINQICDLCLTLGAHTSTPRIPPELVDEAIKMSGI